MLWFESHKRDLFLLSLRNIMLHKTILRTIYYVLLSATHTHRNLLSFFYSFEIKLLIIYYFSVFWGRAVDSASASVQLTNPDLLTEGLVTLLSMTMESYTCFHGIIITVSSVNSPDHHLPFPRYPIHPQPSKTFWQDECSKLVANYANYWQLP